jgi:hypothetical protein
MLEACCTADRNRKHSHIVELLLPGLPLPVQLSAPHGGAGPTRLLIPMVAVTVTPHIICSIVQGSIFGTHFHTRTYAQRSLQRRSNLRRMLTVLFELTVWLMCSCKGNRSGDVTVKSRRQHVRGGNTVNRAAGVRGKT